MNKDTVMTLKNLRKDIEAISNLPKWLDYDSVKFTRLKVLAEIDKTIKRKL